MQAIIRMSGITLKLTKIQKKTNDPGTWWPKMICFCVSKLPFLTVSISIPYARMCVCFCVCVCVSKVEILQALKKCKLETASGIDLISSNLLKIGAETTANWLKVIFDAIWDSDIIPKDWHRQIIIPIYKNGSRSLCQSYRGISLLRETSKIFSRAILNRVQGIVEKQLEDNQCGFKPNRGCCDQLFSTKILMQRAIEFNKPIYFCFIDLQRAYDTVNRKALWEILAKSFDIPAKIIRIIETLHKNTTGLIQTEGLRFEEFPISVGVKQGDVLAPMLFNMYLDAVIRVALKKFPTEGIHLN